MEDGKLLDDPQLGGDFRLCGKYDRLNLDVDGLTGAAYEERSTNRINQRNGYRERLRHTIADQTRGMGTTLHGAVKRGSRCI
jgi:hypothetical protein